MPEPKKEEYSYQIGKITFVVQPVHKESRSEEHTSELQSR